MGVEQFDAVLRSLSAAPSRRSALRLVAGLVLGVPLALGGAETAAHNALRACKKKSGKQSAH